MNADAELLSVNLPNLDQAGFFCFKSKTAGYAKKLAWMRERMA